MPAQVSFKGEATFDTALARSNVVCFASCNSHSVYSDKTTQINLRIREKNEAFDSFE